MKKVFLLVLLAVLLPGLVLAQDDRGDRRGDRGDGRGEESHEGHPRSMTVHARRAARPSVYKAPRAGVSPAFRSLGVRSYPKPMVRSKLLIAGSARSSIAFPSRGPGGVALSARVVARTSISTSPLIRTHMSVITGGAFRAQINIYNANERVVGNYYWHNGNGFNYCHYYDRWGYHWYGWYLGNSYFWTRWYGNNYWWYDPTYYRWCYWHDGGWWWQDPDSTSIYVYNNGSYVPTDGSVNVNVTANTNSQAALPSESAPPANKNIYNSPDGTRSVKVVGNDAFLYDISGQNSFKPIFLGSNVTGAKFSNTQNGGALQVMLLYADGSFGLFDNMGNSMSGGANNNLPSNNTNAPMNNGMGGNQQNPAPPSGPQGNPPSVPGSGT